MNNDDDKKIVWKKATTTTAGADVSQNQTQTQESNDTDLVLDGDTLMDLAQRSADHNAQKPNTTSDPAVDKSVTDLRAEIDAALLSKKQNTDNSMSRADISESTSVDFQKTGSTDDLKKQISDLFGDSSATLAQKKQDHQDIKNDIKTSGAELKESSSGSAATLAALNAISAKKEDAVDIKEIKEGSLVGSSKVLGAESSQPDLESIKNSIHAELSGSTSAEKTPENEQTKKLLDEKEQAKGVEQTYFSDLSSTMGSNEPATMSELLQKAKYEKTAKEILSPRSKRNMMYIAGAIVLFIGIIGLLFALLGEKEEVKYITEDRVASLVYSDLDTGVNTTGIESEKIKQAIRSVVETDIESENVHQVYYAGNDQFGNLTRLDIKDVFEATDITPPDLLYQNIENDFMHGVYKTDKNHPFIVLQALSYDRAFKGMKEWEPRMIDDLSTFFDLPPEAANRSLLESGFSDDIIKNKNVRVARFLPRDVDKRGGILDIFKSDDSTENNALDDTISFLRTKTRDIVRNSARGVFAQVSITPTFANLQIDGSTETFSGNITNTGGSSNDIVVMYLSEDAQGNGAYRYIGEKPFSPDYFQLSVANPAFTYKYFSDKIENVGLTNYQYLLLEVNGQFSSVPISDMTVINQTAP
ncbi:MAG: hypothetical protein ACPGTS_00610, partial [Minisyncoccia bacterium]